MLNMDDDDEMIMIIVGDEKGDGPSLAMPIKEEPAEAFDESALESIIKSAKMHGEYISLRNEEDFKCEYLDDYIKECKPQIPILECEIKVEQMDTENTSDNDESYKTAKRGPSGKQKQSYITELRKNFPKLRKNEEYLVAHLSERMKHTKPPPPPNNFCQDIDGLFICVYCEEVSPSLPAASRHYQKKHGTRYLICYACGADYRCTTGLYKHEKLCAAPDARIVLKARGRYLGRKGRCRPFLTLNKFDPWDLKITKYTRKRYFCSLCTASFTQKETLTSHEHMHIGYRPFQCDRCPVAYTSAVALKRHITIRHTDRQYICDICERSFKAKTSLIVHMDTHLPQRKYPCDRCERRFAQSSALRLHIDRDHLNIPAAHACAVCPKRFPRMYNLKAHMKAKHGMTLMTRQMFFKALPAMKETKLKQATIVFNNNENKVITAPLGESIFNKKGEPKKVNGGELSSKSDEGDSYEEIEFDSNCQKPLGVQIVTEMIPNEPEEVKADIISIKKDNLLKEGKGEEIQEVENEPEEILVTRLVHSFRRRGSFGENKELNQSDEVNVKNETKQMPSVACYQEFEEKEILGTSNDTVIRPLLEENYELEFVKFVEQSGIDKSKNQQRDINTEINEIHKLIAYVTSRDGDVTNIESDADVKTNSSIVSDEDVTEMLNKISQTKQNKSTEKIKINKNATEVKIESNKVNKGSKKRANIIRKTIGTRSGAMKTRSGAIANNSATERRKASRRRK